jgi:hypothetical protein
VAFAHNRTGYPRADLPTSLVSSSWLLRCGSRFRHSENRGVRVRARKTGKAGTKRETPRHREPMTECTVDGLARPHEQAPTQRRGPCGYTRPSSRDSKASGCRRVQGGLRRGTGVRPTDPDRRQDHPLGATALQPIT